MEEAVERLTVRLRASIGVIDPRGSRTPIYNNQDGPEAADLIERQAATLEAMRVEVGLWRAGKLTLTTMPDGRPCIMHHPADPNAEVRDSETGEVIFPAVKAPLHVIEGSQ